MCVSLMGNVTQSGSTGAFATLVSNGITYTAQIMGSAGNSITIALVAGGTAGAEVVTVSGRAISVAIESGVSTRTQVKTALDASAAALALINTSVTSGGTAATLSAAAPLASGADTVLNAVGLSGLVVSQIGTGLFQATLSDPYKSLLSASISVQKASAADLQSQMVSADPSGVQTIVFRTVAGATPTNLASGDKLYIRFDLRNSSQ